MKDLTELLVDGLVAQSIFVGELQTMRHAVDGLYTRLCPLEHYDHIVAHTCHHCQSQPASSITLVMDRCIREMNNCDLCSRDIRPPLLSVLPSRVSANALYAQFRPSQILFLTV